jgi:hypothetical protein
MSTDANVISPEDASLIFQRLVAERIPVVPCSCPRIKT